jgi:hypothetical protein
MMQIEYLGHSSFLVTCNNTNFLFDPWLVGSTYDNAWYLWPLPTKSIKDIAADVILISHGHEDHLNTATLKELNKNAQVFFPFQWREGIKPFLNHLGFEDVTEAVNFKTYTYSGIEITYVSFSLESVIVIKYNNEVLVNINDALNSNHENATNFMLKEIKKRWPNIDYLLSGWSGAGYFPNQIRYPEKNDIEVGKLREQYFANNFCVYTNHLQPKYSLPIASGFVLLKKENHWINHIKFARTKVEEYYKKHFPNTSNTKIFVLNPGDTLTDGIQKKNSEMHNIAEEKQYDLAYNHYQEELIQANRPNYIDENKITELIQLLKHWINYNKQLYHIKVLEDARFTIRLEDVKENSFLNITFQNKDFAIERNSKPLEEKRLQINTYGAKLILGLKKMWGGDIITSGYALTVDVYEELTLEKNLDIVCVRLITRYPLARKDMFKYPFRALKFYASNPKSTSLWIKQKIVLKPYVNKFPFNERDHWITYNKCDLCAVCKMPEINLSAYD